MKQSKSLTSIIGFLISVGLVFGLGWANYRLADNHVGGDGFFIQWISIRSLVLGENDPYSDLVTRQIREVVDQHSSFVIGHYPRYTSPLFSGVVVLPAALIIEAKLAHAYWLTAQLVAIFSMLLFGLRLTSWKPAGYIFFIFALLTLFSYHILVPWLDGGLAIWASFFILLALLSMRNHWNEFAGIFLALSAIQPQMTILVIIFILVWAASQKKRVLVIWFFMALVLLSLLGVFFVPDWIIQYLRILYNFSGNFPAGSPADLFSDLWPGVGRQLGWFVTIVLSLTAIIEAWIALRRDFRHFLWTVCLVMVISQWVGIPIVPGNFSLLLLPMMLVSTLISERWSHGGQWASVMLTLSLFLGQWALFYLDITSAQPGTQLSLIVPLPLTMLIGLYWVRWWAIKSRRFLLEDLRSGEIL